MYRKKWSMISCVEHWANKDIIWSDRIRESKFVDGQKVNLGVVADVISTHFMELNLTGNLFYYCYCCKIGNKQKYKQWKLLHKITVKFRSFHQIVNEKDKALNSDRISFNVSFPLKLNRSVCRRSVCRFCGNWQKNYFFIFHSR